jgi:hypothetical protein
VAPLQPATDVTTRGRSSRRARRGAGRTEDVGEVSWERVMARGAGSTPSVGGIVVVSVVQEVRRAETLEVGQPVGPVRREGLDAEVTVDAQPERIRACQTIEVALTPGPPVT